MGTVSWTKEQEAAIYTRGCNLLVAAAAGSGKTAVLVERIIQMITSTENPVDIDRLLVVTFTNAAAAEMRERIGAAIGKKIEENPYDEHLLRQLTLLHRASITTIHAFCLDVIRSNFHLLDLDPAFRIADATEIVLLKAEVLETLFEALYEESSEEFLGLIESYGGKTEDLELQDMILKIHSFVQSSPWPRQWMETMVNGFAMDPEESLDHTRWGSIVQQTIQMEIRGLLEAAQKALKICQLPGGPAGYEEAIRSDIFLLEGLREAAEEGLEQLYEKYIGVAFAKLGRCSKDVEEGLQLMVKEIRDKEIKKGIEDQKNKVFFKSPAEMKEDLRKVYPVMKTLGNLVIDFSESFQRAKREKALVDFNDLEHYCLHILLDPESHEGQIVPSPAAKELQGKYEEILIDEYQDSNMVQELLLSVISRQSIGRYNMFMVGDVKQSIYRFRLAKPELFMDKYMRFGEGVGEEQKIDLFQNFRSRKEVLVGINFLFRQMMTEVIGELKYDEKAALNPGAKYPEYIEEGTIGGPVELHLIEQQYEPEEGEEPTEEEQKAMEELEELSNIEVEARIVAQRILQMMGAEENRRVFDKQKNGYRPVEFRDIVILLRATSRWAEAFMEELLRYGIPAYADISTGYFQAVEVQTMMSLLQIIDNPRQDIPLITVLRSPIVSLNSNELVEIRTTYKVMDFYEAAEEYAQEEIETPLGNKLWKFLTDLRRWREMAVYTPIDELLWTLYGETNYYNYIGAMVGGIQRQGNLKALLERASQYENTSFKGLFHFIRFIQKLQDHQGDMGAAKILGENENLVKLMSIHKSKGLEFPVVFVSGMGKQFNQQDLKQPILLHQDLGLGPNYIDYENRVIYNTIAKSALSTKIGLENLSEEMRILYVAFTRAKEKLIITGTTRDLEKQAIKWVRQIEREKEELPPYYMMKARTYLDWVAPAVARHPDGERIRDMAGYVDKIPEHWGDDARWEVKCWGRVDIAQQDAAENEEQKQLYEKLLQWDTDIAHSPEKEAVFSRLNWKYPFVKQGELPVKISITEIKKKYGEKDVESFPMSQEIQLLTPNFMQEKKKPTAAQKGTIIHLVMEHLDLDQVEEEAAIGTFLTGLVERKILSEEEKRLVLIQDILRFVRSPLAQRMKKASALYKEVPFVLGLPPEEIYEDLGSHEEGEYILLRGIIDCFFEEEDGVVLVDYKTDYTTEATVDQIISRYKIQLDYYARAIEQLTGKKVKERYLYLFSIGKAVLAP